jgi:hypothetical protein
MGWSGYRGSRSRDHAAAGRERDEDKAMHLAFTMTADRGGTDPLLAAAAAALMARGVRLCGAVQENGSRPDIGPCDMDVRVLPGGPIVRISQNLGSGARGCRLDTGALETAVALVEARLARGADAVIVNKFGKHEAAGRGFRTVIADALGRGLPVLVGVNALNREAFLDFAAGAAAELPPSVPALVGWLRAAVEATTMLAPAK